jgi:hypothetical protein
MANHGEGLAMRSVPQLRLCAGGTPQTDKNTAISASFCLSRRFGEDIAAQLG